MRNSERLKVSKMNQLASNGLDNTWNHAYIWKIILKLNIGLEKY